MRRYAEPDKAATGLGRSAAAWPVPYWTVDAAFAVMTLLLAAEDAGLGALFFGVFQGEAGAARRARACPPSWSCWAPSPSAGPPMPAPAARGARPAARGVPRRRSSTGAGGEAQEPAGMPHFSWR